MCNSWLYPARNPLFCIQNYVNVDTRAEQQYISPEKRRTASLQLIKQSAAWTHEGKAPPSQFVSRTTIRSAAPRSEAVLWIISSPRMNWRLCCQNSKNLESQDRGDPGRIAATLIMNNGELNKHHITRLNEKTPILHQCSASRTVSKLKKLYSIEALKIPVCFRHVAFIRVSNTLLKASQ